MPGTSRSGTETAADHCPSLVVAQSDGDGDIQEGFLDGVWGACTIAISESQHRTPVQRRLL